MSQFTATKCDECGRIRGEVNHWMQAHVFKNPKTETVGIVLGKIGGNVMGVSNFSDCTHEPLDLCGQGCAMKQIAKLLGWNVSAEQATREERG